MTAIPTLLLQQWESGTWLGECDWGHCGNEQIGWAQCDCDDPYCGKGEWLSICAECLERGSSKPGTGEDHTVARSLTFDEIEATCFPTDPTELTDRGVTDA